MCPGDAFELHAPVCDCDVAVLDVQLQWPREGGAGGLPFGSGMHADAHLVQSIYEQPDMRGKGRQHRDTAVTVRRREGREGSHKARPWVADPVSWRTSTETELREPDAASPQSAGSKTRDSLGTPVGSPPPGIDGTGLGAVCEWAVTARRWRLGCTQRERESYRQGRSSRRLLAWTLDAASVLFPFAGPQQL